jgi:hypothetical protein
MELLGAMGLDDPRALEPHHIFRRVDDLRVRHMSELYDYLQPGQLLSGDDLPIDAAEEWKQARADGWTLAPEQGAHGGRSMREEETA